jgi:hypothetical protein
VRAPSWLLVVASCYVDSKPATVEHSTAKRKPTVPCVDAVSDAAERVSERFQMSHAERDDVARDLAPTLRPDLDGDGQPDAIFSVTLAIVPMSIVYVRRTDCTYYVGDTWGRIDVLPSRTHGWADLDVHVPPTNDANGPVPAQHFVLRFDGTTYGSQDGAK